MFDGKTHSCRVSLIEIILWASVKLLQSFFVKKIPKTDQYMGNLYNQVTCFEVSHVQFCVCLFAQTRQIGRSAKILLEISHPVWIRSCFERVHYETIRQTLWCAYQTDNYQQQWLLYGGICNVWGLTTISEVERRN